MKEAAKRGWGDWHGAARAGIGNRQGIGVASKSSPSDSSANKPGWIDADTYTDGLNTFKKGADGNLKRITNLPGQPATLTDKAREFAGRAAEGASRLDPAKLKAIGAATEGFRPEDYFKTAPPVGTSTNNDNSVRHQSYNRGDSTVNIYTQADARETHDLWRRHEDRQKADDLRHASNVFAA